MENYNLVLECFQNNDEPMNATAVAEKTGIDKKEVSKVMDKLKKEDKINSDCGFTLVPLIVSAICSGLAESALTVSLLEKPTLLVHS